MCEEQVCAGMYQPIRDGEPICGQQVGTFCALDFVYLYVCVFSVDDCVIAACCVLCVASTCAGRAACRMCMARRCWRNR